MSEIQKDMSYQLYRESVSKNIFQILYFHVELTDLVKIINIYKGGSFI